MSQTNEQEKPKTESDSVVTARALMDAQLSCAQLVEENKMLRETLIEVKSMTLREDVVKLIDNRLRSGLVEARQRKK